MINYFDVVNTQRKNSKRDKEVEENFKKQELILLQVFNINSNAAISLFNSLNTVIETWMKTATAEKKARDEKIEKEEDEKKKEEL